jgi:arabinan endo-1,5-alpha-L-arabinosidase
MYRIQHVLSLKFCFLMIAILSLTVPGLALDGQIGIHDPSTLMLCDGTWYTWGTGGTALESDDGWTWRSGTRCPASGAAPDVIHVGDKYFQYISHGTFLWTKSLNPESPDYGWNVEVQRNLFGYESEGDFINPIDPGCLLDPITGKLWLVYGSYFGYTRVIELDTETGLRVDDKYYDVAINCEAATMIYNDGWYYLLATLGSCCQGANSGYNIRVGRSKSPTGPFVDNMGVDMMQGGGKLVQGSGDRKSGAGHFGLIDLGDGVQKFSLHWEADLDRSGSFGVLDVRSLMWKNGWPVGCDNFKEGTYQIESVRTGTSLELAVEGVAVGGGRGGRGGGRGGAGFGGTRGGRGAGTRGTRQGAAPGGRRGTQGAVPGAGNFAGAIGAQEAAEGRRGGAGFGATRGGGARGGFGGGMFGGRGGATTVIPDQNVAEVSANWPSGNIDMRLSNYMCQAQQKWTVTPVADAGGYLGSPYFKITIAGTERILAVGEDGELVALPVFTGEYEQLWRIDLLTDGTWRIMPKFASTAGESLALSAIGSSFATLEKFNPESDKQRWLFKNP